MKSTQRQKKIIYSGVVLLAFLLVFLFAVFMPQSRKLKAIKDELNSVESQISQISGITEGRQLEDVVKMLNQKLDKTDNKLPQGEESVLNFLSTNARELGVNVKNIALSEHQPMTDKIIGYKVDGLGVSMILSCDYRSLGEFLRILNDENSMLIRVKQLNIRGSGEGRPKLDVNLQLSAYLSKQTEEM